MLYDQINKDIEGAKEKVRKKERLEGLLQRAKDSLNQEEERLRTLKKVLQKEEKDVKKLEGMSFRSLIYTILGNKQERLNKEQSEFVATKLKYDECRNSVQVLKEEIEGYSAQLSELGDVHHHLDELLKKKEELILSTGDKNAGRLQENLDKISQYTLEQNELKEAILAGNNAIQALEEAKDALDDAENMGTWDILGGGFLVTSMKHSSIDEAIDYVSKANSYLNTFSRELRDVNINLDLDVNISSFEKFADYFFDNFIMDINVQNKIKDSQDSVNCMLANVRELVNNLNRRYDDLQLQIAQLQVLNRTIIEEIKDQAEDRIEGSKYIE